MAIGLPPFVTSAAEGIARKLARARQYALDNPRFTNSLVGGLTAQTPQDSGFWGGLQAGLGGSFGAGQRYDQMTHEQERQALRDEWQAQHQAKMDAYTEALTARAQREPQRPTPSKEFGAAPWYMDPKYENDPFAKSYRSKATRPPAGRAPKAATPPKPREAVMKRIDLINQADPANPEHRARLEAIVRNPATPEEAAAAQRKLNSTMQPHPGLP